MGTWIEISLGPCGSQRYDVVPYVGTWIEIGTHNDIGLKFGVSFPTWERG